MTAYNPPIADMAFLLDHVVGLYDLPAAAELDRDTVEAILDEAGKLARDVLAPLNHSGDQEGAHFKGGVVTTSKGFRDAYIRYRDGGWNAVPFSPDHGGQGLPWGLGFAIQEMWQSANMAFGLCPLLTQGAVEAIEQHGSDAQKSEYLEKLVSGEWAGTMNLTEGQAGSDLSAIRTRAEAMEDGNYKIFGEKIFITYGEHDFTDNIIHLVLARIAGAPEGVKGISLFIVPKFLADGTRNDVHCTGIEDKLGIHASPTCTMHYGDHGGAIGMLVGAENEGLKYMFTMMNIARLSVGLQGVALAERAYQQALSYAKEREQGGAAIIHYPDVARMLLSMRAQTEAARALTYEAGIALDRAQAGDKAAQAQVDVLTPVIKACFTDMAVEVASLGVQIHGGAGYIEETGSAQYYRDARILPIYEGTNGIQANDLAFRKIIRDDGQAARAWFDKIRLSCQGIGEGTLSFPATVAILQALEALEKGTEILKGYGKAGNDPAVGAVYTPYLQAFGIVSCAAMLLRSCQAAERGVENGTIETGFRDGKRTVLDFYCTHILPQARSCLDVVANGAEAVKGAVFE